MAGSHQGDDSGSHSGSHSGGRENRLADEISPYLLLHKHNPVDWYPWGDEALAKARQEDKPIFLSVGYSTCFWCHVMERESFSDAGTAKLMNEHFVNIKVDREERPELDEIYMAATQLYARQGGWPNSVFLTPELEPFFAGTYFPPQDLHGRPSFKTVLLSMHNAWTSRRSDVQEQAAALSDAMRRTLEERGEPADHVASAETSKRSLEALASRFDEVHGGFGDAPKFPSPGQLYLLLDFAETGEDPRAQTMLESTLDAMGRGGIYDQLAGGFHRYATDREWKIPHFEKMLYDNAHLLEIYARDYARTGDEERARIVRETARFVERELTAEGGGFYSAIDAEVAGKEGAHHVWTHGEIVDVIGEEDAGFLAPLLGFAGEPFFEEDHFVLHLPKSYGEQAERRQKGRDELLAEVRPLLERLLDARREREMPLVDDKVLTDWNGMAIRGLAVAGDLLGEEWMVDLAAAAGRFVLDHLYDEEEGVLLHSWREGEARYPAYLADYAFLVRGFLALHDATGDDEWLDAAERLSEEQIERLADPAGGFFTAGEEPDVLFRSKEIFDGALPSANAIAALNLLDLAAKKGPERWLGEAEKTLRAFTLYVEKQPEGARMMSLAARRYERLAGGPVGPQAEAEATAMNLAEKAARKLVQATLEVDGEEVDSWRPFRLSLAIREGWHIYAADPGDESLEATTVEGIGTELRDVEWPQAETMEMAGVEARVYEGEVEIRGELLGEEPRIRLRYQPCDEARCLAAVSVEV